jgi:DNA ligase-1
MTFRVFAQHYLLPLENTAKKLEQTEILSRLFHEIKPEEAPAFLYLLLGQTGPIFANKQYFFGLELMLYALAELSPQMGVEVQGLFGETVTQAETAKQILKKRYKQLGDIGALTQEIVTSAGQTGRDLQVDELYEKLVKITKIEGEGSQEEKILYVSSLLKDADPLSAKYIVRMIMMQLRLGFSDKTLLDAFSWYLHGDKSARIALDDVYQRHPDIGAIGEAVLRGGVAGAEKLDASLGVPIVPALCDRLKTTAEMIEKMGEVYVDPKYDGTRLQIHWDAKTEKLSTFTRNLEENSAMFPELKDLLKTLDVESIILDAEAVGYSPESNELVTFQQTIKRKRKHGIEEMRLEIPLRFFVFDLLFLNGESYLHTPLSERREKLEELWKNNHEPDLTLAPTLRTADPEIIEQKHREFLNLGLEGIVVKKVDGKYQSGRKAFNWVKLKELQGTGSKLTDTIDAVVLGYYYGRGKRTVFGVGAFLIGIFDEQRDTIVTLAKIGTGLSDEQWRELYTRTEEIQKHPPQDRWTIDIPEHLLPDVVLPPSLVVEVAADEITKSPLHTAGVALRFPRLVRFRDDKRVQDITTKAELGGISVGRGE